MTRSAAASSPLRRSPRTPRRGRSTSKCSSEASKEQEQSFSSPAAAKKGRFNVTARRPSFVTAVGALAATDSCSAVSAAASAAAVVTPPSAFSSPSSSIVGGGRTTSRYFASDATTPTKLFCEPKAATAGTSSASGTKKEGGKPKLERTQSFQPIWNGSLHPETDTPNVDVHTVILGTHPSIASLSENQYFGHTQNAFWWIAGDCLGFRRKVGVNAEGKPYKLTQYLRYDETNVIPYEEQVEVMTSKGFALWDLVKSCERKGSLDSAIKNEEPNDIRGFCSTHPSVKRIVFANGGTGCTVFNRHFKEWWLSGELKPGSNPESVKAFDKFAKKTQNFKHGKIECISALSVSPAAARYTYEEKRDFWDESVYSPGLLDHEELQQAR